MAEGTRKKSVSKKKTWECPYCAVTYPDEKDSLQCDTCENWVCLPCTKISDEMYNMMTKMNDPDDPSKRKGLKWVCRLCDKSMPMLKEMNNTLGTIMKTNSERFDNIESQVNKLENSIGDKVTEEVTNLKVQLKEDLSAEIDRKIAERLKEESDRRYREMNLCFFNVPLCKDKDPYKRKTHDEEIIYRLYETVVEGENVKKPLIKNVFRLYPSKKSKGAITVTKATFVHKEEMRQFLSFAKNIKTHPDLSADEQDIIVSRDLSVEERKVNKKLREELKEKNKDGKKFTIRNGRVVPKVTKDKEGGSSDSDSPSED